MDSPRTSRLHSHWMSRDHWGYHPYSCLSILLYSSVHPDSYAHSAGTTLFLAMLMMREDICYDHDFSFFPIDDIIMCV